MTQITANGNTYSDDGSAALDMQNGGHRTHLLPMLGDVMTDTSTVNASAAAAAASATAAQNYAAALQSTSTTSFAIGTGSKAFTTQVSKQFAAGQWVTITSAANNANNMFGQVTSYVSTTLTVNVTVINGSGTHTDWNISIAGVQGASSAIAALIRSARTSNTIIAASDIGTLIDITSGTFTQTFSAAATLGNGFWCYIRNSGTGDITLDPNGAETIDGLASYIMYPGEVRLIQCDASVLRTTVISGFLRKITSTETVTVPPGYSAIGHRIASGSGGGGSGRRGAAGSTFWGGSGGGGAGRHDGTTLTPTAGGSVTATVGAAGTGGAAQTVDSTNGVDGTAGGSSSLSGSGFSVTVSGGGAGKAGTTTAAADVTGGGVGSVASTGGVMGPAAGDYGGGGCDSYVGNGQGGDGGFSLWGGGGGGCGIGYNTGVATTTTNGGTSTYGKAGGNGGGGGTAGSAGASAADKPGGGGGGGGAALNGTNSGAGGAGVAGWITVWGII